MLDNCRFEHSYVPIGKGGNSMSKNASSIKKKISLNKLVILAMLVAIEIILSRFLSIAQWNMKFSFAFIPVVIAGILYGPIAGGLVGGISDFIGAILFPIGPYFPGFTFTAILIGVVYSLFLYKKQTIVRIISSAVIVNVVLSLLVNSAWIALTSGSNYFAMIISRGVQCAIMTVASVAVISLISLQLMPRLKSAISKTM